MEPDEDEMDAEYYEDYAEDYTLPEDAMYGNEDERFAMEVCPDDEASIEFYPHPNITLVRGAPVTMYDLNFDIEAEVDEEIHGYLSHVNIVEDDDEYEQAIHPNVTVRRGRDRPMSISELDIDDEPTRHVNIIEDFDEEDTY
jgi:hypothetical protein